MSAPLPVELSSLGAPCPACGAPLLLGPVAPTRCPGCAALVGAPGRFVDASRRRKPLRPAFSLEPPRACGRCRACLQRVLVDDVAGAYCGTCNLVIVARGAAARVLGKDADRLHLESGGRTSWLGARLPRGVVVGVVVAALAAVAFAVDAGAFS